MIRGEIYGREVAMAGSPYTLLVFKREFDCDLPSYLSSIYGKDPLDIEDFLKVAWAMCRTYDDDVRDYEDWLMEFPEDLFSLAKGKDAFVVITSAIDAELFRKRETIPQRVRRWLRNVLARWVERLS